MVYEIWLFQWNQSNLSGHHIKGVLLYPQRRDVLSYCTSYSTFYQQTICCLRAVLWWQIDSHKVFRNFKKSRRKNQTLCFALIVQRGVIKIKSDGVRLLTELDGLSPIRCRSGFHWLKRLSWFSVIMLGKYFVIYRRVLA